MTDEAQPIETAPKDHRILVWAPIDFLDYVGPGPARTRRTEWMWSIAEWIPEWEGVRGYWFTDGPHDLIELEPTHWRPLPPHLSNNLHGRVTVV